MTKDSEGSKQEDTSQNSSNETNNEAANKANDADNIEEDEWMIRPCDVYYDEYDDCMSIRGRFHQYFIFGEVMDCNQWKKDYDNCYKWKKSQDAKAMRDVIQSERLRRYARLKAHYENDIWKERKEPPKDWNTPLPEWIQKRDENTYLAVKAKELREANSPNNYYPSKSYCNIM